MHPTPRSNDVVYDWLAYHSQHNPDYLAAVDLATGRRFGYLQLNERATRLATALQQHFNVSKTDRVSILAHNSTDFFELMFACWKLGAVFMPLNWRLSAFELGQLVEHGEPRVIFCDEEFQGQLAGIATPKVIRRPGLPDCEYESLIAAHDPAVRMPRLTYDDINALLYTSGTTGRPKGVIYNFRMTMNIVMAAALSVELNRHSRTLTYTPLFHTAGLNGAAMPGFHWGSALYVMKRWDAAACLNYLSDPQMGITHSFGVPTHYITMSEQPGFEAAKFPTLKYLGIGSAPVSLELLERWERKGIALGQSFGMTEAFSVSLTPPDKARSKLGSAGQALMHVEVQIGDDTGTELPRGTVGEIQIRGPTVTPGYWHEPGLTAAAFVNGWFRSGDAGRMEADGTIYVVDRFKDMFISGGENVYPSEVEHVIAKFPEVSQVAVIGIPDPKWTEVGMALIILRSGACLTAEQVLARCRERLAGYKIPKSVQFVDSLPTSPQGKILKRELRDAYRTRN